MLALLLLRSGLLNWLNGPLNLNRFTPREVLALRVLCKLAARDRLPPGTGSRFLPKPSYHPSAHANGYPGK